MGKLVRNITRRINVEVAGAGTQIATETVTLLNHGKVLFYQEGRPSGSLNDNEPYVVARVQVEPGYVIRVVIYGEDNYLAVIKKHPAALFGPSTGSAASREVIVDYKGEPSFMSAFLAQMNNGGAGFGGNRGVSNDPNSLMGGGGFGGNRDENGFRYIESADVNISTGTMAAQERATAATSRLGQALLAQAGFAQPAAGTTRIEAVRPPAPAAEQPGELTAEQASTRSKLIDALGGHQIPEQHTEAEERAIDEASS